MALTSQERDQIWAKLMREVSALSESIGVTKDVLRTAVDDTDGWIEVNQSSYNQALSSEAQAGLSAKQKAMLFCYVALRRFEVL